MYKEYMNIAPINHKTHWTNTLSKILNVNVSYTFDNQDINPNGIISGFDG